MKGSEVRCLKRKKYIKPFYESKIFYFEKEEGLYLTTVLISQEKTLIYEYQNSFVSKTVISDEGYIEKKRIISEVRSSSTNIVEVGYSYDQSVEMSHPNDFELKLAEVINDVNEMYFANGT